MSKHTPGPWTLEPSPKGGFNVRDPDKNVPGIARTYARFGEPEDTANAHLIVAAPDLFRELVLAHQTAAYYAEHESDPGKKLAWLQRAKGHAAAIAKAEGEK